MLGVSTQDEIADMVARSHTQQFARPFQRLSSKIMVSRANELHNTKALGAFTRK